MIRRLRIRPIRMPIAPEIRMAALRQPVQRHMLQDVLNRGILIGPV